MYAVSGPAIGPTEVRIITDVVWNYIQAASAPRPPSNAAPVPPPPLGPANQFGLGYGTGPAGVAVSAGQVIDQGVVMCKYVYPLG
jgi:hypothetical protein